MWSNGQIDEPRKSACLKLNTLIYKQNKFDITFSNQGS